MQDQVEIENQIEVGYPAAPNTIGATESNIPTLSGLFIGFIGALFVATLLSDSLYLNEVPEFAPLIVPTIFKFSLKIARGELVLLSCFVAMTLIFYCILNCVKAQMFNYDEAQFKKQHGMTPSDEILIHWKKKCTKGTERAVHYFNFGFLFATLPLIFMLPIWFFSPSIYIWLFFLVQLSYKVKNGIPT